MVDPIARGISTFAALKGMDRQQKLDEERQEDRTYQRGLLERQELRADEQYAQNKRTARSDAKWKSLERKRKKGSWKDSDIKAAREESDQILLEFTTQMKAAGKTEWGEEETQALLARLEPVQHGLKQKLADLYDPELVDKRLAATKDMLYQLKTGEFDHDTLLESANIAFAPELNARGQKYGAKQVRFSRRLPSPQGDGFVAELDITKDDGSTYRAPATANGGTAEDGDHEVKIYKMAEVAPYLIGQLQSLQGAEAYLKSRGKIKEKKRKVMTVGSDKAGRHLVYEDNGEEVRNVHGPIADDGSGSSNGKTERIKLKTGRVVALDDLRKSYIASYGKYDALGNLDGTVKGAPNYNAWVNEQAAEPVFWQEPQDEGGVDPNDPAYMEAKKQAEAWVNSQAGLLSTDGSDFAKYGGNREQALMEKTQEFYQLLKGGGQAPQVVSAAQGLTPPAQAPQAQQLDPQNPEHMQLARKFLKDAGGDKDKARQLAQQSGYSF